MQCTYIVHSAWPIDSIENILSTYYTIACVTVVMVVTNVQSGTCLDMNNVLNAREEPVIEGIPPYIEKPKKLYHNRENPKRR